MGDDAVSIRRRGSSEQDIARIVGRECDEEVESVFLDRVIHHYDGEDFADGWMASGAFASVFCRPVRRSEQKSQ